MENTITEKSFHFAVRIVKCYRLLCQENKEYTISKQLLRAGTSIGANVAESQQAQSRADFISKLNIALKEASETKYWLRLLHATDYLTDKQFTSLYADSVELEKMLVSILKSCKSA